jgi:hypothetical protein
VRLVGLEPTWLTPTDFHTTTTFVAKNVCGLDFTFTIEHYISLGVCRQVSTPSQLGLARY